MTQKEAIKIFDSEVWKEWTHEQRAKFQIAEDRLCMPFGIFHESVEKTLGRPVFSHEFGLNRDGLMSELLEGTPAPTFQEIMELIPEHKRIVIQL